MTTKPPDRDELEKLVRHIKRRESMSPDDIRAEQEAKLKAAPEDKNLERQRRYEQEMRQLRNKDE